MRWTSMPWLLVVMAGLPAGAGAAEMCQRQLVGDVVRQAERTLRADGITGGASQVARCYSQLSHGAPVAALCTCIVQDNYFGIIDDGMARNTGLTRQGYFEERPYLSRVMAASRVLGLTDYDVRLLFADLDPKFTEAVAGLGEGR